MKVKGLNASAVKTKRQIRKAFLQMHNEKIVGDEMTVTDLCKRAEISRSAFYTHYHDLFEVGEEIVAELTTEILDNPSVQNKEDILPFVSHFLAYVSENEESCCMLLGSDYPLVVLQQFRRMIKSKLTAVVSKDSIMTIQLSLLVDGMMEQLIAYFQGRCLNTLDMLCSAILDTFRCVIHQRSDRLE